MRLHVIWGAEPTCLTALKSSDLKSGYGTAGVPSNSEKTGRDFFLNLRLRFYRYTNPFEMTHFTRLDFLLKLNGKDFNFDFKKMGWMLLKQFIA